MKPTHEADRRGRCGLCLKESDLQFGHIYPRFAVKWMKETSATGYLRNTVSQFRMQDAERQYLMCRDCEQILSRDEKTFAEQIFLPYHERTQTSFEYGPWLARFLAGLHWKVIHARSPYEGPEQPKKIIWDAEFELRSFLLGQNSTAGRAEFHLILGSEIKDANYLASPKLNAYVSRTLDGDCVATESGTVGIYAKILKIMTLGFLTPPDPTKERWEGTRVFEQGTLKTPQYVESSSLIPFIKQRTAAIEEAIAGLPAREQERISKAVLANPKRAISSESYRSHVADRELQRKIKSQPVAASRKLKGRDRNAPCPCGSGEKLKKCHGR